MSTPARHFLGIDPGLSGALACIDEQGRVVTVAKMPTQPHGKSKRVSGAGLRTWLAEQQEGAPVALALLEQVASRPGQGVASVFSFGRSYGAVEGVLSALAVPLDYVTPTKWKPAYGLSGADKAASIAKAIDLFPELAAQKLTHGQAEAVLLAEYGRRRWMGATDQVPVK